MQGLREQIFGEKGYSADFKLSVEELCVFRELVNSHWLSTINTFYPSLMDVASSLGIEDYHIIAENIDHQKLWNKARRVLPQSSVEKIKNLPFLSRLKKEFGVFSLSDVYDTEQRYGHEEIYWRLVRPYVKSDIGSLHRDTWFHGAFNDGYGMFSEGTVTAKIWIPIYCEPGKSGLIISEGSHLKEYKYHIDIVNGNPRPQLDDDPSSVDAVLIPTEPGNLLIFNERILHAGAVNVGKKTRVSAEITMVFNDSRQG